MNNGLKAEILEFSKGRSRLVYASRNKTKYDTALSRDKLFLTSELYDRISKATSFLPNEAPPWLRLKCVMTDTHETPKCPVCGRPRAVNESKRSGEACFRATCGSGRCHAKMASDARPKTSPETKAKHSASMLRHKMKIRESVAKFIRDFAAGRICGAEPEDVRKWATDLIRAQTKNGQLVKEQHFETDDGVRMLAGLINATEFIPLDAARTDRGGLKLNERLYCAANGLRETPVCRICRESPVEFVNAKTGYAATCPECSGDKFRTSMKYPTLREIRAAIDPEKFEIISFPEKVTKAPLIVKCRKCGTETTKWLSNGRGRDIGETLECRTCAPYKYVSGAENELAEFVKTLTGDQVLRTCRDAIPRRELDIYVPAKAIAVEFDGLYWHCDEKLEKSYHLKKTEMCLEKGIRLVHVFENEWSSKREIVKSRISSIFGIYGKTVYARKCEVRDVAPHEAAVFLEENHLQGAVRSKIQIGLYEKGELVALMTFGKCRFDKKHEWEMLRFCCRLGTRVIGGAGKLLAHFEKAHRPMSLVSYADRRWSDGALYRKLGFNFVRNSAPNYWYFDDFRARKLASRIAFQKAKLKSVLRQFDPSKSEYENMKANGYHRIFDCGNMVFEKTYAENEKAG